MSSGMPFKNLFSLTEPLGPPSPLAPLSETRMIIVFSSCSVSSRYVQQAAKLIVGMRQEAGVHLGHPAEQLAARHRTARPTAG